MKETSYKEILNNILLELFTSVSKDLELFDEYIKQLLGDEKIKKNWDDMCLKYQPDIISLYRDLYKLNLERNKLYEYLYKYEELKDNNLDLLKEINSLIYEANFARKLNIMIDYINQLNKRLWWDMAHLKGIELVERFFNKLKFDSTKLG